MILRRVLAAVGGLTVLATSLNAQTAAPRERPTVEFSGDVFDVTGAGLLELGDFDAVLSPFHRDFAKGEARLDVEVTIDRSGAVIACQAGGDDRVSAAGQALCTHALAKARFEQFSLLDLDYNKATYSLTIRSRVDKVKRGESRFVTSIPFTYERIRVRFGEYVLPPVEERLTQSDLRMTPMSYPPLALRNAIEAEVAVSITFDETGRAVKCRPIHSSQTARMAYETCMAARRHVRLLNPPDPRPYVWRTVWKIEPL